MTHGQAPEQSAVHMPLTVDSRRKQPLRPGMFLCLT